VKGTDARCLAMLQAMQRVVSDYETPMGKTLEGDLNKKVDKAFQFLTDCRPHSVSMGNAKTFLRGTVAKLAREKLCDAEVKEEVRSFGANSAKHGGGGIAARTGALADIGYSCVYWER